MVCCGICFTHQCCHTVVSRYLLALGAHLREYHAVQSSHASKTQQFSLKGTAPTSTQNQSINFKPFVTFLYLGASKFH